MLRFVYIELKKIFQLKTVLLSILSLGLFFSLILFSNQKLQNEYIKILAQNIYTSSVFYGSSNSGRNDEEQIQSFIDRNDLEKVMEREEITEFYNDLKKYYVDSYDAVMNLDFERYNQLEAEYWRNERFALLLYGTADQWGQVRFQTESCQGEAVCDSAGMYPLQPKELAEYNLYYHVYPQEYKQASDYVLELLTGYHILFVPLLGIFVSYLTLNQEKKENSDKTLWAQPYSKLTIFISKIIANFMMSALILLLTVGFVYLLCGLFSGFHSSQRLMSVYTSFLNGGGKDAVSEYTVIEQWQFNLIILCQNLFTLLVSTVICHFLSLYICNKKLLFFITVCLFLGLPLLIGELVQQVRFHQYSYILKGLYLIYTLLPLHIRYS